MAVPTYPNRITLSCTPHPKALRESIEMQHLVVPLTMDPLPLRSRYLGVRGVRFGGDRARLSGRGGEEGCDGDASIRLTG